MVDIPIPGLDDLLRDSSMIDDDFKFDLAIPGEIRNAPVKSLGEILDRGLYHTALEGDIPGAQRPKQRETERRAAPGSSGRRSDRPLKPRCPNIALTAVVYPTLRRKPARVGDGQGGPTAR